MKKSFENVLRSYIISKKWYIVHVISRNGLKKTPFDFKSEKMEFRGKQNGPKGRPKGTQRAFKGHSKSAKALL